MRAHIIEALEYKNNMDWNAQLTLEQALTDTEEK